MEMGIDTSIQDQDINSVIFFDHLANQFLASLLLRDISLKRVHGSLKKTLAYLLSLFQSLSIAARDDQCYVQLSQLYCQLLA